VKEDIVIVTAAIIKKDNKILIAKRRANGVCQLCRKEAPFKNKNGEPYLETHHIKPLSKAGADTIENTVALCPNCHRRMHVLNDIEDIMILQKGIIQNIFKL